MNNVPDNELLSAYLDGELTAAEQAEVEQLLAVSPAARQLMDELRALSSTLQSLPQYKLGEDLSERVLRVAERQMLMRPRPNAEPRERSWRTVARRVVGSRAMFWAGLTLTVGLLLMVMDPGQERVQQRPIARGPDGNEQPVARAREAEVRSLAKDREPLSIRAVESPLPPEGEGEALTKEGLVREKADNAVAAQSKAKRSFAAGDQSVREPLDRPMAVPADAPVAFGATPPEPVPAPVQAMPGGPGEGQGRPLLAKKGGPPIHAVEEAQPMLAPAKDAKSATEGGVAGRVAEPALSEQRLVTNGQSDQAMDLKQAKGPGTDSGATVAKNNDRKAIADVATLVEIGQTIRDVAVVRADISPTALQSDAFTQLLQGHGIIVVEDARAARSAGVTGRISNEPAVESSKRGQVQDGQQMRMAEAARDKALSETLDVVYVEATPAQIEGTLADMTRQARAFLSVSVEPAPGQAVQQSWKRYGRAGIEELDEVRTAAAPAAKTLALKPGPSPDAKAGYGQANVDAMQIQAGQLAVEKAIETTSPVVEQKAEGMTLAREAPSGHAFRFLARQDAIDDQLRQLTLGMPSPQATVPRSVPSQSVAAAPQAAQPPAAVPALEAPAINSAAGSAGQANLAMQSEQLAVPSAEGAQSVRARPPGAGTQRFAGAQQTTSQPMARGGGEASQVGVGRQRTESTRAVQAPGAVQAKDQPNRRQSLPTLPTLPSAAKQRVLFVLRVVGNDAAGELNHQEMATKAPAAEASSEQAPAPPQGDTAPAAAPVPAAPAKP